MMAYLNLRRLSFEVKDPKAFVDMHKEFNTKPERIHQSEDLKQSMFANYDQRMEWG
jgi:Skp family chaperone for outer membrane proteins